MRTFRISNVQEQSYYAIRIFGIVHLVGAIGLILLLDGPSDGLRGISYFLIIAATIGSVFLMLRVAQARAGRIHGHYVLTKNTLAIVEPGRPRRFIRREECTGLLPVARVLILRGKRKVPLKSSSSRAFLGDLMIALGETWWTGLYGTPLWGELFDRNPQGPFELRVDFRSVSDAREPLLIFAPKSKHWVWHSGALPTCVFLFALYAALLYFVLNEIAPFNGAPGELLHIVISAAMAGVGALASFAAFSYILRQLITERAFRRTCVLSSRCLAVLDSGNPPRFYRSDALTTFNSTTGTLYFQHGESFVAAPYRYGGPYYGLLRCLFNRWRPGAPVIPVSPVSTGPNLIVNTIVYWFFACQLIGQWTSDDYSEGTDAITWTALALCIPIAILCFFVRREFLRNLAARTDVAIATEPGREDVATAHHREIPTR